MEFIHCNLTVKYQKSTNHRANFYYTYDVNSKLTKINHNRETCNNKSDSVSGCRIKIRLLQ